MRFVYVLEDDPKFQKDICEAIYSFDPKIQVRFFEKLEDFATWIKAMMQTGPEAIAKGGNTYPFNKSEPLVEEAHTLSLVISKIEFLGKDDLDLLRRTRDVFVQRKICTKEDPTSFVLTAFEDPAYKITELEDRILNNVIFKPFDRLILAQHLICAIDGRHPPSQYAITSQKATAVIEMLKDAELEAISDVGFVTKAYRPVEPGSSTKYYGNHFKTERHRSIFAVVQKCEPHPEDNKIFRCTCSYFAADQSQISNIRRKTRENAKENIEYPWLSIHEKSFEGDFNLVCLDPEEMEKKGAITQFQKAFPQTKVISYENYLEFIADVDPASALSQQDATIKAFSQGGAVTLIFDKLAVAYHGHESDKKEAHQIFGQPDVFWKNKGNWLQPAINPDQKERFRAMALQGVKDPALDDIFSVKFGENRFFIKLLSVKKDETGEKLKLEFIELTKDEQIAWLMKTSRLPEKVHALIAPHNNFGEGAEERWTKIKEKLFQRGKIKTRIFMTSKKDFKDSEEREFAKYIDDIFYKPVDLVYILQKLKFFFSDLQETEAHEIKTLKVDAVVKVAGPVTVTELSEAGVVMEYYRPIGVGGFREFVLWQPYEVGAQELLATCNYVEESQGKKGTYNCHFIFFGITDQYLKAIRIWIRDNYVQSKSNNG